MAVKRGVKPDSGALAPSPGCLREDRLWRAMTGTGPEWRQREGEK